MIHLTVLPMAKNILIVFGYGILPLGYYLNVVRRFVCTGHLDSHAEQIKW
jgi:hypothetical protein